MEAHDELAYDRVLTAWRDASGAALVEGASLEPAVAAHAAFVSVSEHPAGNRARALATYVRQHTRFEATVPEIDDALDYIDAMIVPELIIDASTTTLAEIAEWHEQHGTIDSRVQPVLWSRTQHMLEAKRTELLAARAAELTAEEARSLGLHRRSRVRLPFARGKRTPEPDDRVAETHRAVTLAFVHGLEYNIAPSDLVSRTDPGRVGRIAAAARAALAEYAHVSASAAHRTANPGLEYLIAEGTRVEPLQFER